MTQRRRFFVYIMASRSLNLYTGVTNNIYVRALQHKRGEIDGFTKRYNINRLVYYETFQYIGAAIVREKQIKGWTRAKRIALIKSMNPTWQDLAAEWGKRFGPMQIPRSDMSGGEAEEQTRDEASAKIEMETADPSLRSG